MMHDEITDNPYTLPILITKASGWYPENGGFRVYYADDIKDGIKQGACWVTDSEAASFHPHLPHVLKWLAAETSTPDGPLRCDGVRVKNTVLEWQQPLHIIDLNNKVHAIVDIFDIKYYEDRNTVMLLVDEYEVYWNNVDGEPISYASKTFRPRLFVEPLALDQLYPGWLARYRVLSELDIKGRSMVNLVLTAPMQTSQVSINDLTFE